MPAVTFARSLELDVTIVLIDQAWPSWLGLEAWLLPWVAPVIVEHARRVGETFADLVGAMVAFTDRRALVARGFVDGTAPPWRRAANADALAADRQLLAVLAELRRDAVVGPMLVDIDATASVGLTMGEISRARADVSLTDVYVRSLVAGTGPTGSPRGLLARRAATWVVDADEELLGVLR